MMKLFHRGFVAAAVICAVLAMSDLSFAEPKEIGVLDSFRGGLVLKNNGVWGESPREGMTLFHGDKIVTDADGSGQVTFHDGAVLKVKPNSSVRLAEMIRASDSGKVLERQREVRLFVGNLNYKSGNVSPVQTKLVSPTAVAALRGTEADFGTDGLLAMLDQIEGESDLAGDVTRTDAVAHIDAKTAAGNPDYKASGAANKIRQEYLKAVKGLLSSSRGKGRQILLSFNSNDPLLLAQLLAQNGGGGDDVQLANKVLVLAALYVLADCNALTVENRMLFNNPDETVRNRAIQAFEDSQASMALARQTLLGAKETAQQINELINKALSGDPEQIRQAIEGLKPVLEGMVESQRAANQQALGEGYQSNAHTAGFDDSLEDNEDNVGENAEDQEREYLSQTRVERLVEYFLEAAERREPVDPPDFDEMFDDLDDEIEDEIAPDEERGRDRERERERDKRQEEREPRRADDADGDGIPDDIDENPNRPYGQ